MGKELRTRCQELWRALDSAGVYVPPPEDGDGEPVKQDKFQLERHGHGRGNTKSMKKRRSRETQQVLESLLDHLSNLASAHGVALGVDSQATEALDSSSF